MTSLTPNEILSILQLAHKESRRNHLMLLMAFKHGLRASEVTTIKISDVKDGSLKVVRLKDSAITVQPLEGHVGQPLLDEIKSLKAWLAERPTDRGDALFPSSKGGAMTRIQFYRLFNHYATLAALPVEKRHPHCLKHSLCTLLIRAGVNPAVVQARAGHKTYNSTQRYIHMQDDEVAQISHDAFQNLF